MRAEIEANPNRCVTCEKARPNFFTPLAPGALWACSRICACEAMFRLYPVGYDKIEIQHPYCECD